VVGQVNLGGKEAVVNPKLLKQQFDSISRKYSFATNPAVGVSALLPPCPAKPTETHPNHSEGERGESVVENGGRERQR